MESLNLELALYGSKNECTRIDTVLPLKYEVITGAVSLNDKLSYFAYLKHLGEGEENKRTNMTAFT